MASDAIRLSTGTCAEIATGAPVPPGTDRVLPVEDCTVTGRLVDGVVRHNRNVRATGEDAAAGDLLVPVGQPLRAATLGLLAAAGYDGVMVRPRPRVDLLLTGDELRTCGRPGDGFVRDAVGPMLVAQLRCWDADVAHVEHVPDTPPGSLSDAIARSSADAVLACGATSAGATDRLRWLLVSIGARLVVDGVACRPGHPQLLAVLPDGRPLVGLPGNPFAALGAALTLGWATLAALGGRALPALPVARINDWTDSDAGWAGAEAPASPRRSSCPTSSRRSSVAFSAPSSPTSCSPRTW